MNLSTQQSKSVRPINSAHMRQPVTRIKESFKITIKQIDEKKKRLNKLRIKSFFGLRVNKKIII